MMLSTPSNTLLPINFTLEESSVVQIADIPVSFSLIFELICTEKKLQRKFYLIQLMFRNFPFGKLREEIVINNQADMDDTC